MNTRPHWIVFDAVGTLITPEPTVAEAYAAVGRRYGVDVPIEDVRQRFRVAFRESETACFPEQRRGCTSEVEEVARWRWIVRSVLPQVSDIDGCFRDLWEHFADPAHWRVYDDVAPATAQLRERGIGIVIASNFDERLHGVRDGLAELREINRVFVSSTLGARKPDPRFYRHIETELQTEACQLFMVGDDPACDVDGPRACGWQARRLHRSAAPDPDCWGSLSDLIAWLDHSGAE